MAKRTRRIDFNNAVAIVTGGASGIGKAVCEGLAARGARVVIADINMDAARLVADELKGVAREVDVCDPSAVQDLVDTTIVEHGRLDLMFNNAGIAFFGLIKDMSIAEWHRVLDVDVRGVVYGVHAALPVMTEQQFGQIVNTASLAGYMPSPGLGAYSTAKHAVVGLSKAVDAEGYQDNVGCTAICPGVIRTNIANAAEMTTVTKLRGERDDVFKAQLSVTSPAVAARQILAGVERRKTIVHVARDGKLGAAAYRHFPRIFQALVNRNWRRVVANIVDMEG